MARGSAAFPLMAPSLLAAAASPFLLAGRGSSRRPLGIAPTRRAGLRVAALKYDHAKEAPQADRMLVRLKQIPEASPQRPSRPSSPWGTATPCGLNDKALTEFLGLLAAFETM